MLPAPGKDIFPLEVTNISAHGFWLLYGEKELFLPFDEFPWFRDKPVKSIFYVVELTPGHFYWPDMDVDLTLEIIEHPERFPLKAETVVQTENMKSGK